MARGEWKGGGLNEPDISRTANASSHCPGVLWESDINSALYGLTAELFDKFIPAKHCEVVNKSLQLIKESRPS